MYLYPQKVHRVHRVIHNSTILICTFYQLIHIININIRLIHLACSGQTESSAMEECPFAPIFYLTYPMAGWEQHLDKDPLPPPSNNDSIRRWQSSLHCRYIV